VGMVRPLSPVGLFWFDFPHARGDGPATPTTGAASPAFSPRPWGWSPLFRDYRRSRSIFPTPVGMVR